LGVMANEAGELKFESGYGSVQKVTSGDKEKNVGTFREKGPGGGTISPVLLDGEGRSARLNMEDIL